MFGHRCKDCHALFVEMRSAIMEANALVEEARALVHARKPSEHIVGWWQTRDRWQSASRRWMLASAELKNQLATHRSTPNSAKSVAKSRCADKRTGAHLSSTDFRLGSF
jgi:hypothetical protein